VRIQRSRYIWLSCLVLRMLAAADDTPSRFDPPFQNDLHAPRAEDAQIIQILKNCKNKHLGIPRWFGVVQGNFLDGGRETVVVAALRQAPAGASTVVFLFVNEGRERMATEVAVLCPECGLLQSDFCRFE